MLSNVDDEYKLESIADDNEIREHRHLVKVRQLRNNPYGVDGFVAVTRFVSRETIFSFNHFEEGA